MSARQSGRMGTGMKVTVLAVGKVKEKFYRDALAEYQKRLGRYCQLSVVEVEDERTQEDARGGEDALVLEKEAKRILQRLPKDAYCIVLAIDGKRMSSVAFSQHMEKLLVTGKSHIVFVIGGSLGLHRSVLDVADEKLSFSDMTFPHQLMRVILLEQLYRGFRIASHEPYHK